MEKLWTMCFGSRGVDLQEPCEINNNILFNQCQTTLEKETKRVRNTDCTLYIRLQNVVTKESQHVV